jgi:hypothetical protein
VRFAVAKQQGLTETIVADIGPDWDTSETLSDQHKAALAFADGFLANEPSSVSHMEGAFDLDERREIAMALALYHGFSKVLIVLGLEPEPGTMDTTELPTPNTASAFATLNEGFVLAETEVDRACSDTPQHAALLAGVRARIASLLDTPAGAEMAGPDLSDVEHGAAWRDIAEMFVVDIHSVDDQMFAAAADPVGPQLTTALFVGMALADGRARLAMAGSPVT